MNAGLSHNLYISRCIHGSVYNCRSQTQKFYFVVIWHQHPASLVFQPFRLHLQTGVAFPLQREIDPYLK